MNNSKIVVFTNSYPYGNGYNWLDGEMELFHKHFDNVIVSPFSYEGNKHAKDIPPYENVKILRPVLSEGINVKSYRLVKKCFTKRFFFYIKEAFVQKVISKSYWFKTWLQANFITEILLNSEIYSHLRSEKVAGTVLYFYWGNNQTLMIPFLRRIGYDKVIVRFHGFDLYKDRLGGYQPYRTALLKNLTVATTISEFGMSYLKNQYPHVHFETKLLRLGVVYVGRTPSSIDGCIRIVSCARIILLKRIHLIVKVLKLLPFNVEWTHIGDGDYRNLVEEELRDLPSNVKVNLVGWKSACEVQNYYANNATDLFISLSESEGIPVSIMEALAAGIPVFSTDVGGIREIVDDECGHLIDVTLSEHEIAAELKAYLERYLKNASYYKDSAFMRFRQYCDRSYWDHEILKTVLS